MCGRFTGSHKVVGKEGPEERNWRNGVSNSIQLRRPDFIIGIVLPAEWETLKTYWVKLYLSQEGAGQSGWGSILPLSLVSTSKVG